MIISDNKTVRDIQQEFHAQFPGLRMEFYAIPHAAGEASPAQEQLDPELKLKFVRELHNKEELKVDPNMSVADFEQALAERFGLNAQVFRKSGNLWMQTTSTDHWALSEQNRKGLSSVTHYDHKYKDQ